MPNKIHKKTGRQTGEMDRTDIQPRSGKLGQGKAIVKELPIADRKIEVELRHVVRVAPKNFDALKNSFENWAAKWE